MKRSIVPSSSVLVLLAWAVATFYAVPGTAQQAHLTLVPEITPWNEQVEARITGVGCSGAFAEPLESIVSFTHVVDIDLLDCDAASTAPFTASVKIGPLYPGFSPYRIRVRKGPRDPGPIPPPLPVLDEVELPVHEALAAFFVLPEVATDASPVTFSSLVESWGDFLTYGAPYVHENVIELAYENGMYPIPVPPPGTPGLESIPWDVGILAPGVYEVRLFEFNLDYYPSHLALTRTQLVVYDAERCVPSPTVLCLGGGRFKVEAVWNDFAGGTGVGHARPLDGDGASGLLWFFAPDNVELTAKLLDGCSVNDHFWFFLASGSTVEYTVTVTDTVTGATRTYANASGYSAPLLSDTSAFSCSGS